MEFLITLLIINLHSRNSKNTNTSSGHSLFESRICQKTLHRGIRVGRHFPWHGFLIARQEFQGNAMPLLRCCNLGLLLGKKPPSPRSNALNLTNEARQSVGMRERNDGSVLLIRGWLARRIHVFCLVDYRYDEAVQNNYLTTLFEHSFSFPCDSMNAESTVEISSEFSRQFAMLHSSLQSVYYDDRRESLVSAIRYESGSTCFSKTAVHAPERVSHSIGCQRGGWVEVTR